MLFGACTHVYWAVILEVVDILEIDFLLTQTEWMTTSAKSRIAFQVCLSERLPILSFQARLKAFPRTQLILIGSLEYILKESYNLNLIKLTLEP